MGGDSSAARQPIGAIGSPICVCAGSGANPAPARALGTRRGRGGSTCQLPHMKAETEECIGLAARVDRAASGWPIGLPKLQCWSPPERERRKKPSTPPRSEVRSSHTAPTARRRRPRLARSPVSTVPPCVSSSSISASRVPTAFSSSLQSRYFPSFFLICCTREIDETP